MRKRKCRCCKSDYKPDYRTYRHQKVCSKKDCQEWRKREKQKKWNARNPGYGKSRLIKQRQWRKSHPNYQKDYRKKHPEYEERNRMLQKKRDAKKQGFLVKQTEIEAIRYEKLDQIVNLRNLVKQTAMEDVIQYQIVGIVKYLKDFSFLVKQTDIDRMFKIMRKYET